MIGEEILERIESAAVGMYAHDGEWPSFVVLNSQALAYVRAYLDVTRHLRIGAALIVSGHPLVVLIDDETLHGTTFQLLVDPGLARLLS